MAKSSKSVVKSVSFKYNSEVTVTAPEFQLSTSVRFLDTEALSSVPTVKIDIGSYKTDCCERHVRAVIRDGMVVGMEVDPCSDKKSAGPVIAGVAEAAFKRAGRGKPGKWKPMPLRSFLTQLEEPRGPGPVTNCIEFTIFGHTYFCCRTGNGPTSCIEVLPITVDR